MSKGKGPAKKGGSGADKGKAPVQRARKAASKRASVAISSSSEDECEGDHIVILD